MERFALPVSVLAVVEKTTKGRQQWDIDSIKSVTDDARQLGVAAAIRRFNRRSDCKEELSWGTANNWLLFYKKHNKYFQPQKRGRHALLSPGEQDELMTAAKKLRAAPSTVGITAGDFAAVSRGIVGRLRPAVLESGGGPAKFSKSWAKSSLEMRSGAC